MWKELFVHAVCLFIAFQRAPGQTCTSRYDRGDPFPNASSIREPASPGAPVVVTIGIALRDIVKLDMFENVLVCNVWMRLRWHDNRLRWNPDDDCNRAERHVPSSLVWKPDIVLYNNAVNVNPPIGDPNVVIQADGNVTFLYRSRFSAACRVDPYLFPFDTQQCYMKFGSWSHGGETINLIEHDLAVDQSRFELHGQWDLLSITSTRNEVKYACCDTPFPDVTFAMTLERRPWISVTYLLVPMVLMNILGTFQFMLPCDSGEKITLGITVLLALMVYLPLLQTQLPISRSTPIIIQYNAWTVVWIGVSQIVTVYILMIHHKGMHDNHRRVPAWVRYMFLHRLASIMCMHRQITTDDEHEVNLDKRRQSKVAPVDMSETPEDILVSVSSHHSIPSNVSGTCASQSVKRYIRSILKHVEERREEHAKVFSDKEVRCEWMQLAMVFDRLAFCIYSTLMVSFITYVIKIYAVGN